MAAGVFTNLEARPTAVQVLGLVALGAWLLVALLFIRAVAFPVDTRPDPGWTDAAKFVKGVGEVIRTSIVVRFVSVCRAAIVATITASLLTVGALALATIEPGGSAPEKARIALTAPADRALKKMCGTAIGEIEGTVNPDNLTHDVVPITLPAGECGGADTVVRLPKADIVAEQKITRASKGVIIFPGFP